MSAEYDDIIHLPHHRSSKRRQMSLSDRAAQFAPFAALTGFDDHIAEKSRELSVDEAIPTLARAFPSP